MKKIVIAAIVFVLLVAIALTTLLVIGLNGGMNTNLQWGGWPRATLANRQVFDAAKLDTIQMNYSIESITLLPSTGGEVVLEEYMTRWDDDMLASTNTSGGTLSISQGRRGWLTFWRCYIKLYVPAEWLGALDIASSSGGVKSDDSFSLGSLGIVSRSGSVHLGNIATTGNLSIKTSSGSLRAGTLTAGGDIGLESSSGSVRAEEAAATGDLAVRTSSGSVKLISAKGTNAAISTSSGSIEVEYMDAKFDLNSSSGSIKVEDGTGYGTAHSSSGSIRLTLRELRGDLRSENTSGGMTITLPRGSSFHFSASTSSGSIKTSFDNQLHYNAKGNNAEGEIGGEAEYEVSCTARSGSVRVEWD